MKKLIFLIPLIMGCSRDSSENTLCTQEWTVMEYCTRSSGCPVVGCGETPMTLDRTFKCADVEGVKEGDLVIYKEESSCAKFYRKYIKKIR
ncbi:hypothetical protein FNJ88_10935 [Chryseobacterium sp. SNU WT5]|uniref:hypothetical protein n=1 Tax=Chryseobacterium sp. SNU WT5 TaxID=2594269 RepID=UPI00117BE66C|nr:hypothetical protein [Chryseobacterium sp. SNU WT5]QDP86033.1 hypothetical protein FNJ88_10935 [Chryseobacterium sp. SNU WT5]